MSDLSDVLHQAIASADCITKSLQPTVSHTPFLKYNRSGEPTYNDNQRVRRTCVIEKKQQLKRTIDGSERMSHTVLTFVGPVEVGLLDRIQLPDGTSSPILVVESPLDSSGNRLITQVWF